MDKQDVSAYVARKNVRVTRGMLGGDPQIGSEEREAYRLHRGDSTSYIHASDVATSSNTDSRMGSYLPEPRFTNFDGGYRSARNDQ